ncbi:dihydrofolate reductase family protein [Ensifer sp. ENS07]|uniref:dihydrofolate reductase family protein n=1 Tax=Ensifer sp. ENS07 TaxID=2769274 RepID=UPI00177BA9FE|nr:dihydrofolate reductase family protein [Ensifer sp. ENS07]MBD9638806.1 dihydrofolate reductase family protein [Ensifer sp. ENS07]
MRPFIICHMVTSIDGRLHPSRFTAAASRLSASQLASHYESVAEQFEADGWIVGRKTMSEMAKGSERAAASKPIATREPYLADRKDRNLAIAIDPKGRVHYGKDNIGGDHIVAVLAEAVADSYLAELREDGVSYIFAGPEGDDLSGAMAQLASLFGAKKLLLEGGGILNGAFLRHRLIDEFSTLIYPAVDGVAGTPSIIDYNGADGRQPGAGQTLRLIGCEALDGGMVWLRHAVGVIS